MGKIYLIDYENIKQFKELITNNSENKQFLFYTDNCPNINIDVISKFRNMDFVKVKKGKQTLDKCLITYSGFLIRTFPADEYFIVSNDSDYDDIIDFWKERGIQISRVTKAPEKVEHNATVMQSLCNAGMAPDKTGEIASIVAKLYLQKNAKQQIYCALIKKYGKINGGLYYQIIKNLI